MKYVIELDSPDFDVLIDAARYEIVRAAASRHEMARQWGKGHSLTIAAGQRERAAWRCLNVLKQAAAEATPERAQGSDAVTSIPVGEDLTNVYGRPRNARGVVRRRYV